MTEGGPSSRAKLANAVIAEAFANIRSQGARSALALLGILIGTASIVAMLEIGHITQRETLKLFSAMGVDMLSLDAAPTGDAPPNLPREAVEALSRSNADIVAAAPIAIGRASVAVSSRTIDMPIIGATPALFDIAGLATQTGRSWTKSDDRALVVVLGDQAAAKLSIVGDPVLPGRSVRIARYIYTVVGILRPTAATGLDPADYANAAFVPLAGSGRVLASSSPTTALIRLRKGANEDIIATGLKARFADAATAIQVNTARDIIATMNAQKHINTRSFLAVGSISLLVGGIGVMNVMLMGVMERRREIGLRAAIGASPRDLQLMFLAESTILAALGGSGGALCGVGVAWIMARASGWEFSLALQAIPLGIAGSAIVGVLFGLHPAIKASRMRPIEALRAE